MAVVGLCELLPAAETGAGSARFHFPSTPGSAGGAVPRPPGVSPENARFSFDRQVNIIMTAAKKITTNRIPGKNRDDSRIA
jgi:hypothetical protein